MSKFNKKISFILVFILILTFVLPLSANAAGPATNLTIHKITGDKARPATNGELTGSEKPVGNPISKISFTYWKVTAEHFATMRANSGKYTTAQQVQALVGSAATGTAGKTAADGTVTVPNLAEGYYWFIEDESTAVKKSAAVPFGLDLPQSNQDGTGYITNLHVYPKNTLEATPTIDKDVVSDGKKSATFNIGDSFSWIIQPTTPKGLDEYTTFTVTDTLASALTYDATKQVTATAGDTLLKSETDFKSEWDEAKRLVKVEFTTSGLEKIADLNKVNIVEPDKVKNVAINIPTKINNTATMGTKIINNATLSFDNGHGVTGTATVENPPEVHTGGKNFIKSDVDKVTGLKDAVFKIKNDKGNYLKQDASSLEVSWVSKEDGTTFTSGADGTFLVKGLAYGDYTIEEIKAPEGYTLPTDPNTNFTVDQDSFNTDNTLTIVNKKTVLPDTGGAGTILFTVLGLILMALAIVLLRKKNEA